MCECDVDAGDVMPLRETNEELKWDIDASPCVISPSRHGERDGDLIQALESPPNHVSLSAFTPRLYLPESVL